MQNIGGLTVDVGRELFLIAGPCVIESESHCLKMAEALKTITDRLRLPFIFKASFDKANRTSLGAYRGPGIEKGLAVLSKIRKAVGVPVLSDVHDVGQVERAAGVLDVLQIPAFLSRQTDLILAAARTGRTINIKKGQFLAPWDIKNVVEKAASTGNSNILITERGCSFGYNNLVVDYRSLPTMRRFGYPVILDATHSVQLPGGQGQASGGNAEYIPYLAKAAVAVGVDGLFFEVHDNPPAALSDGPNAIRLDTFAELLERLLTLHKVARDL
ncbi:MAG: 3-deoxy-8-phosphooctulonate synthase [Acidobacteria bacterium]|nr:3-deoxy-8-phosphooctulonate synthase [Acidobacteriota bacterium]MBI3654983.1 3-deoxy-8-phosphooctulonate synthase [Acidobacteriota bacterium]